MSLIPRRTLSVLALLLSVVAACDRQAPLEPGLAPELRAALIGDATITGAFGGVDGNSTPVYCGGPAQPSCAVFGLSGAPVQGRWGVAISSAGMSGLGFQPASGAIETNEEFLVGTVAHFNVPIHGNSGASVITLTLGITVPGEDGFSASFPMRFDIEETPNVLPCAYESIAPCADRIGWSLPQPTAIQAGGTVYALNVRGFRESADAPLLSGFVSQENQATDALLFAEIVDATAQTHAIDDAYHFVPGAPLTVGAADGVLGNDVDAQEASLAVAPEHGTVALAADGGFVYTPEAGYDGTDSFVYFAHLHTGELALAVVTLTATDVTPPVLTLPADVVVEAAGPDGAIAAWEAPIAVDDRDGEVAAVCTPASGATFPLGETQVSCAATDAAGNTASETFSVRVVDTTAPDLLLPADLELYSTGVEGTTATFAASATDRVDGGVPAVCVPASGSVFPAGTTTVTCTATDAAGNTAAGSFSVTVVSAGNLFDLLVQASTGVGPGRSLAQQAGNARDSFLRGKSSAACGQLGAFLNAVAAQNGKQLSPERAAELNALAAQIRELLGC